MSNYVVVDKEQLEADLTTVADAIREKSGTSDKLSFPSGMASAVKAIESGGSSGEDYLRRASTVTFNNLNNLSKSDVVIDLDFCNRIGGMFQQNVEKNTTVEKITLNVKNKLTICNAAFYALPAYADEKLKHITLNADTGECTSLSAMFRGLTALETIDGTPIDGTSSTNFNDFIAHCGKLKDFRLKKESVKVNIAINSSALLSDETIQSVVDCLADLTESGTQTIELHANIKAKLTEEQITTITEKNWTLA